MKAFCLRKKKNTPQQQYVLLPLSHYSITTSKEKKIRSMTISVTVRNSRNERKLKKKIGNTTTRVKNAMKERFEVIPYVIVQYTPVFSVQEVV
jgi:hypothetical protein